MGTLQHSAVDWAYHAQRSVKASLGTKRGTFWPRGRTLGGSGAINAMAYLRGNRRDYDRWQALGNDGWGWSDVLEQFKKSENMNVPELLRGVRGTDEYHRTGGYLNVEQLDDADPVFEILAAAAGELGYEWLPDFNRDRHIGYGRSQYTMIGGTRCSPAKAFLSPIRERANLHVIKHTMALKLELNGQNVATGVRFQIEGYQPMSIRARKEVIVAAGSINTPQLLMLSGIGRKPELQRFGITPRVELNVGGNLQDHVAIPLFYQFHALPGEPADEPLALVDSLYEFTVRNRSAAVRFYRDIGLMAFYNTLNASDPWPDVQIMNIVIPPGDAYGKLVVANFEYTKPIADSIREAIEQTTVLHSHIIVLNPKSRGHIRLAGADPFAQPVIEANYLDHVDDLRTLVRGIRKQQELLKTAAFRAAEVELVAVNIPGCDHLPYDSDGYWECYVRYMTFTTYHPVGTAKMGPDGDVDAVVDSRLRVRGVGRLRVIDASIMPLLVSGNTNAPTMMIAEMGSDFIKQEYA
ncbi:glucose dehydrogenase [FAD, quinone]-like [Anopheles cruzii]|uniref:glucose dehydrogenase [FAD, quinone]-like n=1 Tax=Anopheles cruzii TaxID=68878 RepID=UPI0022EC55FD|nr:glucose dehydrogenase [FAD, quinone]-like [Anopheles cruzii]XP_052871026.1 glucose dehydrogenase [FAD, quinone]-like [Anopheles cruzii]